MKTIKMLELLLALSIISALAIPMTISPMFANAIPVEIPSTSPYILWESGGESAAGTLASNPEYLSLRVEGTPISTNTTIIIHGEDVYHQNIEAKVLLNATHDNLIWGSNEFPFLDYHSMQPVTFAKITGIIQQNGSQCNSFEIDTLPEPFEDYLGQYKPNTGYLEPGQCYPAHGVNPLPQGQYWVGHGEGTIPTIQNVPVEPSNPDPIKIAINWNDTAGDLLPDVTEANQWMTPYHGAKNDTILTIEGLDEEGNKLIVNVTIHMYDKLVYVDSTTAVYANTGLPFVNSTWSTVCKMWGGVKGEEYYIFTHPDDSKPLFEYFIRIDHITITPDCYDILAYPFEVNGKYPGVTNITVALRDADGNLVHAGWHWDPNTPGLKISETITINFATTGGKIQPSWDVKIPMCHVTATVNLTADTNARTIKVTADANVPQHPAEGGAPLGPALNLKGWTELTFDGVNSVLFTGSWPIHTMEWGWETWNQMGTTLISQGPDPTTGKGPVPPKPWLPPALGGPDLLNGGVKLDGPVYEVMIPLYVGCNLISCPIHPMLCTNYYCEAYFGGSGIPMDLLFSRTSAMDCIEAIYWYNASSGGWTYYIPGVSSPGAYFIDGVGYWIKAEKPCTIEISGVQMENAPFTPPEYPVYHSWNLIGFTSITQMNTTEYFESLNTGYIGANVPITMSSAVGPVWTYDAKAGVWTRNPLVLWPGQGLWMNYKPADTGDLAP
jgi:hypothetical protein